jgi:nucleoside 2-deoxyribosyltransferase
LFERISEFGESLWDNRAMPSPESPASVSVGDDRGVWQRRGAPPTAKRAHPLNQSEVPSRRDQSSSLAQIVAVVYALVLGQSFLQDPTLFEHPLRAVNRTTVLAILVVFVAVAWEFLSYSLNMGRFPYRVRWTHGTSDTGTEEGRFAVDLVIALAYAGLLLTALRTEENPAAPLFAFFVIAVVIDLLNTASDYLAMFKWDLPDYRIPCHLPIPSGILLLVYGIVWILPLSHQALINQLFLTFTVILVIGRELFIRRIAQKAFAASLQMKPTVPKADDRPRIYAAGPLGFTTYGADYHRQQVLQRLTTAGFDIADPWVTPVDVEAVYAMADTVDLDDLKLANQAVGRNNIALITRSDGLLAILDGSDVDSGTASEVGYAAALGKRVVGLRLDSRMTGDNRAAQVNLQVEAFIQQNGGDVVHTLDEAIVLLQQLFGTA